MNSYRYSEPAEWPKWRCPDCRSLHYARVDEQKPDRTFGPGPLIRCVNCKSVYDTRPPTPATDTGRTAEEMRYTVIYKGDPFGARILNGDPAPGRAVGVMLGDLAARYEDEDIRASEEIAQLQADLIAARKERDDWEQAAKVEAAERRRLNEQLRESALDHLARDISDEQAATEITQLRSRLLQAEKGAEAMRAKPPVIEFHQQDWIPGFAAFLPGATTPQPDSRAFCVLNLGSMLSTVAHGDVPASDLPGFIVESMIHEVGHVLEQWAGVEFSEERVEALCDRYRAALNPNQEDGDGSL